MKSLTTYINEKLVINKNIKLHTEYPKTKEELRDILAKRLKENKNADLNDIDVSEIDDMSYLFCKLDPHNIDISEWDVSNVKYMYCMFAGCQNFNSDLSNWDVRNVEDMQYMFDGCDSLKNIPDWYKK